MNIQASNILSVAAPGEPRTFSVRLADRLLRLDAINDIHAGACALPPEEHFADRVLDYMDVTYQISEKDLERIPETGRVFVVANHPFGGIEGLLMMSLLASVRDDVKVLANFLLNRIPELADIIIPVDPFERSSSVRMNTRPLRDAMRWLKEDHMLMAFPSGEVAHVNFPGIAIKESPWNPGVAGLIRKTEAAVLPIFFSGFNPPWFHVLGMIHPRIRTALLPRQVLNKRGHTLPVRVGRLIPYSRLKQEGGDEDMIAYLKMRTCNLRHRKLGGDDKGARKFFQLPLPQKKKKGSMEAIIPPIAPEILDAEIIALPEEQRLLESGDMGVFYARAEQIPGVLQEIGRLREVTFREVQEGTGAEIDLDAYDSYYIHLFIWNKEKQEIVAAYRLGPTDEILPRFGKKGLYSFSLFRMKRKLLEHLNPALEMGRSFVRSEYQKSYTPLLMLWKGIAQYMLLHPRYKLLFGPVSISDTYQGTSRDMMVQFLRMNNYMPDLARLVKARKPVQKFVLKHMFNRSLHQVVEDLDEVESFIADIENDMQGMPILLKQYLKLGGKLMGFNIDPDFGDVLDGLILVDVTQTDPKVLRRYMGDEGMQTFLAHHGVTTDPV